ncbi:MAG: hypothetical protein FJW34_25595, partial [Acidobacteria bacterium]|nr:hypothetical protein [Acidobacteriota bacterium]
MRNETKRRARTGPEMALITVSGQPGCRHEEAARRAAQLLRFELLTDARLRELIAREFGNETAVPDKAFAEAVLSIAARL